MARRILRETEADDAGASTDFKASHRARFPPTINSSTACSQSGYQRQPQASALPRRGSSPPTHRTSRSTQSGLHRGHTSRPFSSYATRELKPDPEPRRRLQPEPNPRISKPYEQHQHSRFKAREEYKKEQSSPDRSSGLYAGSVRQLGRDYKAASCEPDSYERSPHRGDSKQRHHSNRSRDRKYWEPTKRLRDIFTRDTSRRYAPTVEKGFQRPQLADRIRRSSHYDWSRDACRVADRSHTQVMRGEMRSRSKRWEMFDNYQRRWVVPTGDCPRYVDGRQPSGTRHQAEPRVLIL
ncbi:hypothetical protein BDV97DRAFT_370058 [Delphinella strobiligena]|nr:hypothetical protein BDV97DRAFT_370058 [Delphinella strobiligena]